LCLQTYSSLVVAECLKVCNEMWRNIIITEISDFNEARALLTNPSGTYVVQVALSVANKDQVMRIMMALRTHLPRLKPKTRAFWNRTFKQAWKRCTSNTTDNSSSIGNASGSKSSTSSHLSSDVPPFIVRSPATNQTALPRSKDSRSQLTSSNPSQQKQKKIKENSTSSKIIIE